MAVITILVKIKNPTKSKHMQWVNEQEEYAKCLNWCVKCISIGEKLSPKDVPFNLKACIKNEAIRKAKKAVSDSRHTGKLPEFKPYQSALYVDISKRVTGTRIDSYVKAAGIKAMQI